MGSRPPFEIGQELECTIEKLTFGGSGLARIQNFVFFIPFSVPGDHLKIRVTSVKKSFAEGLIIEILSPSPDRTQPQCAVFGQCGGCDWQNIKYSKQLEYKDDILSGLIDKNKITVEKRLPILGSQKNYQYRNRIQLHKDGNNLGYYKMKSHKIVNIIECPLAEDEISHKIQTIRSSINEYPNGKIDIRRTIKNDISVQSLTHVSPELGFAQVNQNQNINLISTLSQWLSPYKGVFDRALDLYSGNGNITFPLSQFLNIPVTGVELNKEAVENALLAQNENVAKTQFVLSDVLSYLKKPEALHFKDQLVILDPPRVGCDPKILNQIAKIHPRALLYVSCNPTTWIRDYLQLQEYSQNVYTMNTVQAIDMFPQTYHIEVLSLITRS